ncbi:uncharacterized protein BXIN_1321 [Babesia sp. Xinjiang]|uniref:uncharacterized protein n=1 Tax=Babesia sp. Xinjiang TaxID=462227 RepID=UPI000A21AA77|nr:uncharacterized protein BXIN_1321 [Babesia sp. Xinjiang]ORM40087.1 hypothetical protein BXIN_1321 [Babesia sp. Xinjiang]
MGYNYTKAMVMTGAAVAVAWLVYYLVKDEEPEDDCDLYKKEYGAGVMNSASSIVEKLSRADVLDLLAKIAVSQEKAKTLIKTLVKELIENDFKETMEELYQRIVNEVPIDPLKTKGLTLFDLDYLVERYQNDPAVRAHIMRMINLPQGDVEEDETDIPADDVVAVYEFMLAELQNLQTTQQPLTAQPELNTNAASLTVQAIIAAKVQDKFGYTSIQIDRAITNHQGELGMNTKFARLAMQIQSEMTEITGTS